MALPDRRNCYQIRHSERRVGVLDIIGEVLAWLHHTINDDILFQDYRGMFSPKEFFATNLAKT